jgi:hypothetical protein
MMSDRRPASTLGAVLEARRRHRFVGRAGEIELFRAALHADGPPFSVLHLHGPGGIGKTSLLEVLRELASTEGATVVHLDGRLLVASPGAVLEALGERVHVPAMHDGPIRAPSEPLVLLIDAYERLTPIDDWIRTELLPRLPATTLTVLASRAPPTRAWRSDPAWRELLRVVSLRNLGPAECHNYLDACGIDAALHDRLFELTHGHPLGLSLFADVVVRGGHMPDEPLTPDLVGDLLRAFAGVVPVGRQRTVLAACAITRVTTEALLRDTIGTDDVGELFTWLHDLSFIESGPDGVFPHDLARDVLEADLRWRDPEEYGRVFHLVTDHIHGRLRSLDGREQLRAIADLKYLFRNLSSILAPVDWDVWGHHGPDPAREPDRAEVLELIGAAEGEASATIAARWWDRQPEGFFVVRGDDDAVRGVIGMIDLTTATEEDRATDPGAQAVWDHAHEHGPPRPGEVVTQTRFVIDRDAYQGPSPTMNAVPLVTLQRQLAMPNLAWDYLTLHEPDHLDEYFALADLHRVADVDIAVGGRHYGVFAHDFRDVPVDDLVRLWTERSLAQDPTLRPDHTPALQVLSQAEFTDAVRQALRDLHRPDLLARNPLLHTRLMRVHADGGEPDAALLEDLVRAAVDRLGEHPRDDKLVRAIERTYVDPAPTQEAAATRLGLPFSTYRRHLTKGIERIVSGLWDQEVYGTADAQR